MLGVDNEVSGEGNCFAGYETAVSGGASCVE